ncbi:DNA polymerase I [Lachnospiraceae bacterium]|jgi:DNA polymerase-1|nr:DNA polymerase I [Lachnospiraceae bacterium]GFI65172.1 DNA polymerase I [Lachnospiraceae bacterium]
MSKSGKLVLIDGHSILNRAFYGVPDLSNARGLHTNAVYGFLNIMFRILEEEKPEYLAVAFDVHAPTFRHKMYEAYKGTRKPMPEELREQVPVMKDVLRAMQVVIVEREGLEADDILGTLAKKAQADGLEVSLVSGDRDLLQIADEHIRIRIPKTKQGKTEIEDYDPQDVVKAFGVTPLGFIDLKALMGDASDNIPGVPKVGQKTAAELMLQYGSLENIYAHVEEITKKSIRESLKENKDLADLSRALAEIRTDSEVELDYESARAEGYFTPEAYQLFKQLEFRNLLSRFEEEKKGGGDRELSKTFVLLQDKKELLSRLKKIRDGARAGLYLALEEARPAGAGRLLGVAVCDSEKETCFLGLKRQARENEQLSLFGEDFPEETDAEEIRQALLALSGRARIATFDIKGQYGWLKQDSTERYFDILIGAYLLNPLKSDYDPETIAEEHLGLTIPGRVESLGKLKLGQAAEQLPEKLAEYCCYGAYVSRAAADVLEKKLQETGMDGLMRDMEMPLSLVLYDMEREGVEVRREELKAYGDALVARIQELEKSIHEQAGTEFNINSPKQLGEILFDNMHIPGGKKTKTGYSTAADVLEKLSEDYPIVKDILEYRGLTKLKSTYADGLAAFIGEDRRIHTSFNQTITATGRISSTEPNLQNIPMRMELGRRIRKVFVPGDGYEFMDADYSQIELRVLAHMSGDEQLIEAYRMDQDIHRITASKVFHTPFDQVTELQRRNAKAVNFGIVYGISSFGLSQDLSISKKEAAEYIEQYFATYPGVKTFLDKLVADAKSRGYVTTMFGRRRPVPELSSSNFMQRSFGERVAMNSPIQGTAADIIKLAMIKVWRALRDEGLKSKLILQVHDELVIETFLEEEERVRRILEENMRSAADLAVTLEIDLHTGENWYEAK